MVPGSSHANRGIAGSQRECRQPSRPRSPGQGLADHGYEVLLFDYRGYGGNEGSPSEEGLALDAAAAIAALAEVTTADRLILLANRWGHR